VRFSFFLLNGCFFSFGLASDECKDVRINNIRVRGHHAVRQARVNLERAMLEQLGL
jgi:hypothetical protein